MNRDRRVGKEPVHNPFELGRGEIAGCRAVILTEVRHGGDGQPKVCRKEHGAIQGFLLRTTVDRRDLCDPGLPQEQTHARQPLRRQRPLRYRERWINDHFWMRDEINCFHNLSAFGSRDIMTSNGGRLTPDGTRGSLLETRAACCRNSNSQLGGQPCRSLAHSLSEWMSTKRPLP